MKNTARFFLGFVAGAAAGAIAGLLLAPEKGKDTRKMISDRSSRMKDDMNNKLQEGMKKVSEVADSAFSLVNEYKNSVTGKTEDAKNKVEENGSSSK